MIFGMLNPEKIWHENLTGLSNSPDKRSYFILGNPKNHFSPVLFIYTSDYQSCLTRKQHLPIPPENVTTLTCELQNFFIWLKVCCVLSNAGSSEKSQLWVVVCGSKKNQLWCVATRMSGKQCHSKCSKWPPCVSSSLFWHWSVAWYTTLCWNSAHVATSGCRKPQHVHINTHTPPVACPRRSTRAMQIIGSIKQQ